MSIKQIKYTANLLLLLYVGYFGCVSIFVHKHIYDGVVYIHSHPYKTQNNDADKESRPPFETHKHTSAGFFTLNQLSNQTSQEADNTNTIERADNVVTVQHIHLYTELVERALKVCFRHRAPPIA